MRFPRFHFRVAIALGLSCLCMSTVPVFADGHVTVTNITNCSQLQDIISDLSNSYTLMNDIDCDGFAFTPLGSGSSGDSFTGTFDGAGHTIRNLNIDVVDGDGIGLFGQTLGATIENVRLVGVSVTGGTDVGTLGGYFIGTTVDNVGVETFAVNSGNISGGFVAYLTSSFLRNDYVFNGNINASGYQVNGGFTGVWDSSSGSNLYAKNMNVAGSQYTGGFAGEYSAFNGDTFLQNAYADAQVSGDTDTGIFAGFMQEGHACDLNNVFANGSLNGDTNEGALVGRKDAGCTISNALFNQTDYTGSACVGDDGNILSTDCDSVSDDASFFYSASNRPLSGWDFSTTWLEHAAAFPTFLWLPPDPPSGLSAVVSGHNVLLRWTNPADGDFDSVTIRRSTSSYPASPTSGSPVVTDTAGTSYTDEGLGDDSYFYSVFAKDAGGHFSQAAHVTAVLDHSATSADLCTLKAYLPLDAINGTGPIATDESGNGYDASKGGFPTPALSSDVPDSGISDPKSYLFSAAENDSLVLDRPVQDDFTMCLWFKTTAEGTGTHHYDARMLFDSEVGGIAFDYGFGMSEDDHLIFGDGDGVADYNLEGTSVVNTGEWTHACVTRKETTGEMRIYVNGTLEAADIGSVAALSDNPSLVIGGPEDGGSYWDGNIDDVRIYDSVLNGAEILSLAEGNAACFPHVSGDSHEDAPSGQQSGGGRGSRGGILGGIPAPLRNSVQNESSDTASHPAATLTGLQERTCKRVLKWFKGKALDRVNARLEKRLGFTCSA